MAAKLRKHYLAFAALAVVHFVVFFPVLFMGRLVSPNDVFFNYSPWDSYVPASLVRVQNSLLNDPPTAYLPLFTLLRNGREAFHWNPYVGSGIPGFGSSASAVLSPFIFFPALVVPLPWVYTAIILLKLNVAFWFAYAWLREERLGKKGAAVGAIVIAAAGVYSARWLWQITNATALYPALLWMVRRIFSGKRTSIFLMSVIALSYALAGFPAAMAYGAYLAVAYALFLALWSAAPAGAALSSAGSTPIRVRRLRAPHSRALRAIAAAAIAVVLGLLTAAPSLVPFIQFLRRSGYLAMREGVTINHYPLHHWLSFFEPQRLGNHALKNWTGDPALPANNDVEAAIYVGALTIVLAVVAVADRRHRRWFWIATAAVIVLAMFGLAGLPAVFEPLPGFKYTAVSRIVLLLPVAAGYLAASGTSLVSRMVRWRWLRSGAVLAIVLVISGELGIFAGTFHPYLRRSETTVPVTPTIAFLQHDHQPYRFAAMLSFMWPNSAEMFRVQDIASHFGSEAVYRRLLQRIDPTSFSSRSTVIQFNSLKFNFTDPLVSMLGVRYFLEHRHIDIIKWTIFAATIPATKEVGALRLPPNVTIQRTIVVDAEPFWSIEVPGGVDQVFGPGASLQVDLLKNGAVVWSRTVPVSDVMVMNKTYVPLRQFARLGETVQVRLRARAMSLNLLKAASAPPGEAPFYYGRVTIPLIFDRELPDGRIFRNLAEVPRFQAVKRLRKLNIDEFIATKDIDFSEEAVITDDPVFPPATIARDARATLVRYAPAQQQVTVEASAPAFLASSEKLTPELRVTVDGKPVRPIQINALFAGVNVPAGRHEVEFTRRIGRGWWLPAALSALAILAIGIVELTFALRRR